MPSLASIIHTTEEKSDLLVREFDSFFTQFTRGAKNFKGSLELRKGSSEALLGDIRNGIRQK
jgi:hypothetical protein